MRLSPLSLRRRSRSSSRSLSGPNMFMVVAVLLPAYRRAGETEGMWLNVALLVGVVVPPAWSVTYPAFCARRSSRRRATCCLPHRRAARHRAPTCRTRTVECGRYDARSTSSPPRWRRSRRGAVRLAALMHDLKTLVAASNLQIVKDDDSLSRGGAWSGGAHQQRDHRAGGPVQSSSTPTGWSVHLRSPAGTCPSPSSCNASSRLEPLRVEQGSPSR